MSSQPYASPAAPQAIGYDLATVLQPLAEKAGWMKFIGIWTILTGVLYSLTIIGAIFGVPMIIAGLNLTQSAGLLQSSMNDPGQMREASQKLATCFFIVGILLAISLVLTVLYFVAIFAMLLLGGFGAMHSE